jgi:DNA-binding transcriptional ArsR family regulator
MLNRKIYQLCTDGSEVSIYLRDQQRWLEGAHIVDLEGDLVTIRYEIDDEDEISSWEEMVRIESIGALTRKLASVPRGDVEIAIADDCDCPASEQIHPHYPDSNLD